MTENTIDLQQALVHFKDHNIVHLEFRDNYEIDMDFVKRFTHCIEDKAPMRLLVQTSASSFANPEVRYYASSLKSSEFYSALAICHQSLPQRIFGNFLISFLKKKKIKLFQDTEKAESWLREQA